MLYKGQESKLTMLLDKCCNAIKSAHFVFYFLKTLKKYIIFLQSKA